MSSNDLNMLLFLFVFIALFAENWWVGFVNLYCGKHLETCFFPRDSCVRFETLRWDPSALLRRHAQTLGSQCGVPWGPNNAFLGGLRPFLWKKITYVTKYHFFNSFLLTSVTSDHKKSQCLYSCCRYCLLGSTEKYLELIGDGSTQVLDVTCQVGRWPLAAVSLVMFHDVYISIINCSMCIHVLI